MPLDEPEAGPAEPDGPPRSNTYQSTTLGIGTPHERITRARCSFATSPRSNRRKASHSRCWDEQCRNARPRPLSGGRSRAAGRIGCGRIGLGPGTDGVEHRTLGLTDGVHGELDCLLCVPLSLLGVVRSVSRVQFALLLLGVFSYLGEVGMPMVAKFLPVP